MSGTIRSTGGISLEINGMPGRVHLLTTRQIESTSTKNIYGNEVDNVRSQSPIPRATAHYGGGPVVPKSHLWLYPFAHYGAEIQRQIISKLQGPSRLSE